MELWVRSPCIAVCELNLEDICVGCGRSRDEITDWSRLDALQKRTVRDRAEERLRVLDITRPPSRHTT